MIVVTLNGKKIETEAGKTILQLAQENGIKIPVLCHDEELKPFGSCWVCAVKVKGNNGFVTACATEIYDGMEIVTDSEEIFKTRKMALELLLSDHYADCEAPCKTACPALVDVQSYVALIANGQPHEAVKVIKDMLPMPLSIGRVCPAFCEKECRRTLVEDPIAIRVLKRYAADEDVNDYWSYVPLREESKGKKVAIVGAGPSGLTCGYFLSQKGYDVTVFEAAPEPGGWLRYGIPEYRLPKEVLKKEIELMCSNGMEILTGKALGKDFTLCELSDNFDAVYLAIGAQKAVPMMVKGSNLPGSYLGVDFLKEYMLGNEVKIGNKVAVIGGGNTAIDCARTVRRLGSEVTVIYRRTRKEMPAEAHEVDAAEEEGIKFHFLTNPVEYKGDERGISEIVLEKMTLGEPDKSGRRRPEPTGDFFNEEFDTVIAAISQVPEVALFAEEENKIDGKIIPLSRWSTADVHKKSLYTGLSNVFAGGDFRLGPATAVEAIADGKVAADNIDKYITNGFFDDSLIEKEEFCSVKARKLSEVNKHHYSLYPVEKQVKMPELDPHKRITTFEEVELGYSDEEAKKEAERCLECGCIINYDCRLRDYATEYGVSDCLLFGEQNQYIVDDSHSFILRDTNKCVKCARCVRICSEVQGPGVLGHIHRGFSTTVGPEFGESLTETACEACGKCITVCPVGALTEKNETMKRYPLEDAVITQSCGICGTGCVVDVHVSAGKVSFVSAPEEQDFNKRNICFFGRFGWQAYNHQQAIDSPMIKENGAWKKISWTEASRIIMEKYAALKGLEVSVSPHSTNEELFLMQEIANKSKTILKSLTFEKLFTDELFERFSNPNSFEDFEETDNIAVIGRVSHTLKTMCRYYQRKGKKLALYTKEDVRFNEFADSLNYNNNLIDVLIEMKNTGVFPDSKGNNPLPLTDKTLFLYNRNELTEEEIYHLWELATAVCSFTKGSGILETSYWCNLNAFRQVVSYEPPTKNGLLISCGENLENANAVNIRSSYEYIVRIISHVDADYLADMVIPKPSYLEIEGTVLSDDGKLRYYHNPLKSNKFDLLLNLFKNAGLLDAALTEPSIWTNRAERILASNKKLQPLNRDELNAFLNQVTALQKDIQTPLTSHWRYMLALYESLKN